MPAKAHSINRRGLVLVRLLGRGLRRMTRRNMAWYGDSQVSFGDVGFDVIVGEPLSGRTWAPTV
jgi:hypothetical protein